MGLILLAALLYMSGVERILSEISKADMGLLFLVLATSFSLMYMRAFRWKTLLENIGIRLEMKKLFPVFISGLFISNITPAKTGDPFRSYLLKRKAGIEFSKSFPSVVMERVLDISIVVLLSLTGLFFIRVSDLLFFSSVALIVFYATAILTVVHISASRGRILWFSRHVYNLFKWVPRIKVLEKRIESMATVFNNSFLRFGNKRILLGAFSISLPIWILESFGLYLAMEAFGLKADIIAAAFALTIGLLVGIASSLPGGLGSTDSTMAFIISATLPAPLPMATAAVLVHRLLTTWLTIFVGAAFLSLEAK
ncbi:MAG: flippase-like domain-containing protein [Candidatus Aenigmarchaeota archaeon]|nr:flippase-like domain-containing protein [Candidatus Aenigmarchaeota archaeon]